MAELVKILRDSLTQALGGLLATIVIAVVGGVYVGYRSWWLIGLAALGVMSLVASIALVRRRRFVAGLPKTRSLLPTGSIPALEDRNVLRRPSRPRVLFVEDEGETNAIFVVGLRD